MELWQLPEEKEFQERMLAEPDELGLKIRANVPKRWAMTGSEPARASSTHPLPNRASMMRAAARPAPAAVGVALTGGSTTTTRMPATSTAVGAEISVPTTANE